MAWSHIQGNYSTAGTWQSPLSSATTGSVSTTGNVTAGNVVVVWCSIGGIVGNANSPPAQTSIGNSGTATLGSWVHICGGDDSGDTGGGVSTRIDAWVASVTGTGSLTVNLTKGSGGSDSSGWIMAQTVDEYNALTAIADGTSNIAGAHAVSVSPTMGSATTIIGDLVVSCVTTGNNISPSSTPSGWTARNAETSSNTLSLFNYDKAGTSLVAESVTISFSAAHHYLAGISAVQASVSSSQEPGQPFPNLPRSFFAM